MDVDGGGYLAEHLGKEQIGLNQPISFLGKMGIEYYKAKLKDNFNLPHQLAQLQMLMMLMQ